MMSVCIEWNIPDSAWAFKYKSVYSGVLCEVRGIKQPSGGESCLRASSTLALPSSHEPEPQKTKWGDYIIFLWTREDTLSIAAALQIQLVKDSDMEQG